MPLQKKLNVKENLPEVLPMGGRKNPLTVWHSLNLTTGGTDLGVQSDIFSMFICLLIL